MKSKSIKVAVKCNECGKKFKVANLDGRCPKCRGCDFEPSFDVSPEQARKAGESARKALEERRRKVRAGEVEPIRPAWMDPQ